MDKSKVLFAVILGLLLSGCSTTWHINKALEKCPECFDLDTTISEVVLKLDTIVKIDTNIIVLLPRDTVRIEKVLPKYVTFKPEIKKNGIITTEVSVIEGKLKILSYLDSSMLYHYEDEITFKDALITKLRTINTEQTIVIKDQKKELKWYQKWLNIGKYILIVLVVFLIVGIGYKIYNKLYK